MVAPVVYDEQSKLLSIRWIRLVIRPASHRLPAAGGAWGTTGFAVNPWPFLVSIIIQDPVVGPGKAGKKPPWKAVSWMARPIRLCLPKNMRSAPRDWQLLVGERVRE